MNDRVDDEMIIADSKQAWADQGWIAPGYVNRSQEIPMPTSKELKEIRKDLTEAKNIELKLQQELDYQRRKIRELETEQLGAQSDVPGVGLPMSYYIRKIEALSRTGNRQSDPFDETPETSFDAMLHILKVYALRIQRLEVEVRKLKR